MLQTLSFSVFYELFCIVVADNSRKPLRRRYRVWGAHHDSKVCFHTGSYLKDKLQNLHVISFLYLVLSNMHQNEMNYNDLKFYSFVLRSFGVKLGQGNASKRLSKIVSAGLYVRCDEI